MKYCLHDSPLGPLLLGGENGELTVISLPGEKGRADRERGWQQDPRPFSATRQQLDEYFDGRRRQFDLPLRPYGTEFQMSVLNALRAIPYGETCSYRDIATAIGRPRAVRAVGAANGRNPLPIVIPCHRVIGADGSLTGFGGGIRAKQYLLELEAAQASLLAAVP